MMFKRRGFQTLAKWQQLCPVLVSWFLIMLAAVPVGGETDESSRTFLLPLGSLYQCSLRDVIVIPTLSDVNVTIQQTNSGDVILKEVVMVSIDTNYKLYSPDDNISRPFLNWTRDIILKTPTDASVFINSTLGIFSILPFNALGTDYIFMRSDFPQNDTDKQLVFIYSSAPTDIDVCPFKDTDAAGIGAQGVSTKTEMNCFLVSLSDKGGGIFLNNVTVSGRGTRLNSSNSIGVMVASSSSRHSDGIAIENKNATANQLSPTDWKPFPPVTVWGSQFVLIPLSIGNEFHLEAQVINNTALTMETPTLFMRYNLEAYTNFTFNLTGETFAYIQSSNPIMVRCKIRVQLFNETDSQLLYFVSSSNLDTPRHWVYIGDLVEMICSYPNITNVTLIPAKITGQTLSPSSVSSHKLRHLQGTLQISRFRNIPNGFYSVRMTREVTRCNCYIIERNRPSVQSVSFSSASFDTKRPGVRWSDANQPETTATNPTSTPMSRKPVNVRLNQALNSTMSQHNSSDDINWADSRQSKFSHVTDRVGLQRNISTKPSSDSGNVFDPIPKRSQGDSTIIPPNHVRSSSETKQPPSTTLHQNSQIHTESGYITESNHHQDVTSHTLMIQQTVSLEQTAAAANSDTQTTVPTVNSGAETTSKADDSVEMEDKSIIRALSKNKTSNNVAVKTLNKTGPQNNEKFHRLLELDTYLDQAGKTQVMADGYGSGSSSQNSNFLSDDSKGGRGWNPTYLVQSDDSDYDVEDGNSNLLAVIISLSAALIAVLMVISVFLLIEVFSKRKQIRNTRIRPFLS